MPTSGEELYSNLTARPGPLSEALTELSDGLLQNGVPLSTIENVNERFGSRDLCPEAESLVYSALLLISRARQAQRDFVENSLPHQEAHVLPLRTHEPQEPIVASEQPKAAAKLDGASAALPAKVEAFFGKLLEGQAVPLGITQEATDKFASKLIGAYAGLGHTRLKPQVIEAQTKALQLYLSGEPDTTIDAAGLGITSKYAGVFRSSLNKRFEKYGYGPEYFAKLLADCVNQDSEAVRMEQGSTLEPEAIEPVADISEVPASPLQVARTVGRAAVVPVEPSAQPELAAPPYLGMIETYWSDEEKRGLRALLADNPIEEVTNARAHIYALLQAYAPNRPSGGKDGESLLTTLEYTTLSRLSGYRLAQSEKVLYPRVLAMTLGRQYDAKQTSFAEVFETSFVKLLECARPDYEHGRALTTVQPESMATPAPLSSPLELTPEEAPGQPDVLKQRLVQLLGKSPGVSSETLELLADHLDGKPVPGGVRSQAFVLAASLLTKRLKTAQTRYEQTSRNTQARQKIDLRLGDFAVMYRLLGSQWQDGQTAMSVEQVMDWKSSQYGTEAMTPREFRESITVTLEKVGRIH